MEGVVRKPRSLEEVFLASTRGLERSKKKSVRTYGEEGMIQEGTLLPAKDRRKEKKKHRENRS